MADTKIKICGITNIEDATVASELGADALGFIFYKDSKRFIEPNIAAKIISQMPPFITTVGVFVNSSVDEIIEIKNMTGIDAAQLHGDESPGFCTQVPIKVIKALRLKDSSNLDKVAQYSVQAILFDTYSDVEYGGTGNTFDWSLLKGLSIPGEIILSGGLSPDNVAEAVHLVNPYAVDVSSGVEAEPGKKDHEKLEKFFEAIKNVN